MNLEAHDRTWQLNDEASLVAALLWRDERGGAMFHLTPPGVDFPYLTVRISRDIGDVHYFPESGHPGFRLVTEDSVAEEETTTLVYMGCDPADGEEEPAEFIVSFATIVSVAKRFYAGQPVLTMATWLEL